MAASRPDPYQTLGVRPDATDDEVRAAYRRLVQLHHPDHNRGSADATRRFEEVQQAYATITEARQRAPHARQTGPRPTGPRPTPDPDVESRLADLERQVRVAHDAREKARRAAREAAARTERRPTDEELGYVTTDDTFSKVLADARDELAAWLSEERSRPAAKRVADVVDELASKLSGERGGPGGAER
jgi:curved DNA-binding protein CbpA